MKKHLKASLGLGNFNGSGTGTKQPSGHRENVAGNTHPNKANGSGRSETEPILFEPDAIRNDIPRPRPEAEQGTVAGLIPGARKKLNGESNGKKGKTIIADDSSSDEGDNRKQGNSLGKDKSKEKANGHGRVREDDDADARRDKLVQELAEKIFAKESMRVSDESRSYERKSSVPAKPKGRRRRLPKKHTAAKKPRDSQNGESSNGEASSSEIETKTLPRGSSKTLTPEYKPGDLLWSKIGQCTFWPCMVIEDPVGNKFYGQQRDYLKYYVQYFGVEVTHGWTQSPNRVVPYRGLKAFKEFAAKQIAEVRSRQKFYEVEPKRSRESQRNWDQALREVAEAEAIVPASERYKALRFAFYPGGSKTDKKRSNGTLQETSSEARPSSSASSRSTSSADSWTQPPSKSRPKPPKARTKASFRSRLELDANDESKQEVFNNNVGE